jgi:hypothetical protein
MPYFPASNSPPAEYCKMIVSTVEVYVAIIGLRYGTPVRDRPDVSYTELELQEATALGIPRLIFVLDSETALPLPASELIDREFGHRQDAFRRSLQDDAGLVVSMVATPDELELRLFQALMEVTATRQDRPTESDAGGGGSVTLPLGQLPVAVRGRDDVLDALQDRRGLIVLAGMGGVGKSTVALELARRVGEVEPTRPTWWISTSDPSTVAAGLLTVARRLRADQADLDALRRQADDGPDRFWMLLHQAPEGWLLVFDNADQPGLLAGRATPVGAGTGWARSSRRGLVIVTTRHADADTWGRHAEVRRVNPLSRNAAAQVLFDLAPLGGDATEASALGGRLGGLPLALEAAGRNLQSTISQWTSFGGYQRELDRNPAHPLTHDPGTDRAGDQRATVTRTFELSLKDLADHGLPHAEGVLRVLSCFAAGVPIPIDLLASVPMPELLDGAPVLGQTDMRLVQALRGLARLSLIDEVDGERAVRVHQVVADANRAHLLAGIGTNATSDIVRRAASAVVAHAIAALDPSQGDHSSSLRLVTAHLYAVVQTTALHLDPDDLGRLAEVTGRMALLQKLHGEAATAVDLAHLALAQAQSLGEEHPVCQHVGEMIRREAGLVELPAIVETIHELLDARDHKLGQAHYDMVGAADERSQGQGPASAGRPG